MALVSSHSNVAAGQMFGAVQPSNSASDIAATGGMKAAATAALNNNNPAMPATANTNGSSVLLPSHLNV